MKKLVLCLLVLVLLGINFVSAESYVKRVYGTCYSGELNYGDWRNIDFDYASSDGLTYKNTASLQGYDLSMWNGNVPQGGTISWHQLNSDGGTQKDCSQGCEKSSDLYDLSDSSGIYDSYYGFQHFGCLNRGCNSQNVLFMDTVKTQTDVECKGNKVTYNYDGQFYLGPYYYPGDSEIDCNAHISYTEEWNGTPPVECDSKIYNLGEYHLFVDLDASLPEGKWDWGKMKLDITPTIIVSSDPNKNGKIELNGEFEMDHLGYLVLDTIKADPKDLYDFFILTDSSGSKRFDLIKNILDRLLKDTGKSTGKVAFSSPSVDKNNKLWKMQFKGQINQYRIWSASTTEVYDPNTDVLGPFNREEIETLMNLFGKKIDEIITKDVSLWNNGKPTSSSTDYEKYKGTKKVKGEDHYIEIEKFYKNGKLIKIKYLEHLNKAKETKTIVYILPEKDIKDILKEAKEKDSKTKSQSVWSSSFPLSGVAFRFSPSYDFNENVEINFSSGEDFFHFDDSVIENAEYNILNKVTKTIEASGGELNNSYVRQIFPAEAVLNDTNFSIEIINITKTDPCSNLIQDNGENGIDCGGICDACSENCNDGVQNQDETGMDCGGVCVSDVNESCGYDYNHDCILTPCIPESCSSDANCSSGQGLCINSSCDYEMGFENFLVVMNRWKDHKRNLEDVMDYASSLVNRGNIGGF